MSGLIFMHYQRSGPPVPVEVLLDPEDVVRVLAAGPWYVRKHSKRNLLVIVANLPRGEGVDRLSGGEIMLGRFILQPPDGTTRWHFVNPNERFDFRKSNLGLGNGKRRPFTHNPLTSWGESGLRYIARRYGSGTYGLVIPWQGRSHSIERAWMPEPLQKLASMILGRLKAKVSPDPTSAYASIIMQRLGFNRALCLHAASRIRSPAVRKRFCELAKIDPMPPFVLARTMRLNEPLPQWLREPEKTDAQESPR